MNALKIIIIFLVITTCLYGSIQAFPRSNDIRCDLCVFVIDTIEHLLANNETIEKIEKYLNNLCMLIPSKFQAQCIMLVGQLPEIIKQTAERFRTSKKNLSAN